MVKSPGLVWGYNKTCSFGLMRFDTTREDPQVTLELIDIERRIRHSHTLKKSELSFR